MIIIGYIYRGFLYPIIDGFGFGDIALKKFIYLLLIACVCEHLCVEGLMISCGSTQIKQGASEPHGRTAALARLATPFFALFCEVA